MFFSWEAVNDCLFSPQCSLHKKGRKNNGSWHYKLSLAKHSFFLRKLVLKT